MPATGSVLGWRDPAPMKGLLMGLADKAKNKVEDLKGHAKEGTGKATGDESLEAEGRADQTEAHAKDAGEKVKDAGKDIKDAFKS